MTLLKCPHCGQVYGENEFEVVEKKGAVLEEKEIVTEKNVSNKKSYYYFEYKDKDEYEKLERCLKKYNMLAYKKLIFEIYPKLKEGNFVGDKVSDNMEKERYELCLPTDSLFSKVHGNIKLIYTVYRSENLIILNSIEPKDILNQGHKEELTTYKGVMISKSHSQKDMFKIDLLNMLNKQ